MNGFRSDVERLARGAGEFDEHASKASGIAETLRRAVESSGRCWGDDEVGRSFAAAHREPAGKALARVDALPTRLGGMGAKFAEVARTYEQVDVAGAETIEGVDPAAGQG